MWIAYRDGMGICQLEVDETVYFADGFAWFSCDDVDYKVPIENVVEIGKIEEVLE